MVLSPIYVLLRPFSWGQQKCMSTSYNKQLSPQRKQDVWLGSCGESRTWEPMSCGCSLLGSQPIPPSPALKGGNGSCLRGFSSSALFLARQVDVIPGLGLQVLEAWGKPGSLLVSSLKPQKCPDFKSWRQGIPKPQIPGAWIPTLYKTPADYLLGM